MIIHESRNGIEAEPDIYKESKDNNRNKSKQEYQNQVERNFGLLAMIWSHRIPNK